MKVNEATNIYSKLHDQTKFRWNEINKNKDYFNAGIQERKKTSKKLFLKKKNIATFDYFEKTLTVLCATSGGVCIIYFTSIIEAPTGIASARFSLRFSLTIRIIIFFWK